MNALTDTVILLILALLVRYKMTNEALLQYDHDRLLDPLVRAYHTASTVIKGQYASMTRRQVVLCAMFLFTFLVLPFVDLVLDLYLYSRYKKRRRAARTSSGTISAHEHGRHSRTPMQPSESLASFQSLSSELASPGINQRQTETVEERTKHDPAPGGSRSVGNNRQKHNGSEDEKPLPESVVEFVETSNPEKRLSTEAALFPEINIKIKQLETAPSLPTLSSRSKRYHEGPTPVRKSSTKTRSALPITSKKLIEAGMKSAPPALRNLEKPEEHTTKLTSDVAAGSHTLDDPSKVAQLRAQRKPASISYPTTNTSSSTNTTTRSFHPLLSPDILVNNIAKPELRSVLKLAQAMIIRDKETIRPAAEDESRQVEVSRAFRIAKAAMQGIEGEVDAVLKRVLRELSIDQGRYRAGNPAVCGK